jgi:hypothetical protein
VGKQMGFRASEQQRFFCGKALGMNHECFVDCRSWFLNMAEAELY